MAWISPFVHGGEAARVGAGAARVAPQLPDAVVVAAPVAAGVALALVLDQRGGGRARVQDEQEERGGAQESLEGGHGEIHLGSFGALRSDPMYRRMVNLIWSGRSELNLRTLDNINELNGIVSKLNMLAVFPLSLFSSYE